MIVTMPVKESHKGRKLYNNSLFITGASVEDSSSTISEFYKWEQDGFVPPVNLPQQEYLDSSKTQKISVTQQFSVQ